MMKGIWFDDIHSYEDLNLILSKVNIPPAQPKTNYVDIPGGNGSIDLTEALGEVKYKDRECSFTFTVFPHDDFEEKKREISNLLNGKRCKIIVDKDPDYYWFGRCAINDYASSKNIHQIVVSATVSPYKLKHDPTIVSAVYSGGASVVNLWNARKKVVPIIRVSGGDIEFTFGSNTFEVSSGTFKEPSIELIEGNNQIVLVNGTDGASISFEYQEGDL